jgi:hypothetical protein
MCEDCERPILITAQLKSPELAYKLELDLSYLKDEIYFEKDDPRPDEPVEIRILCPNHDVAYDVMQTLDERYFPEDDDRQETLP